MRLFIVILLNFAIIQNSIAQKEAFNWIWGICTQGDSCELPYSVTIVKFGNDSIERVYSPDNFGGSFYAGTATISDSIGNFLMAYDGKTIIDSIGNEIQELTDLPFGSLPVAYKSFLFLKMKNDSKFYHLIYNYSIEMPSPPAGWLSYRDSNIINMKIEVSDNGYEVIKADTANFGITSYPGAIEATRHANGRDWWILKSGFRRNSFLRGILSPDGLSFEDFTTDADTMYNNAQIWHAISADGTKFYHFMGNSIRILDVYDFDRCTGELSNLRSFDFSEHVRDYDFTPFNLSPDGTKVYMLKNNYGEGPVYQNLMFDISTGIFQNMKSGPKAPCLAPNLKQIVMGHYKYLQDGTFDSYISLLNEPNEYNEANLDTFAYVMPTWGYLRVPHNWANHMLGPVDGSSCDTLGLNQDYTWLPKVEEETFLVFPNPSSGVLNVRSSLKGALTFSITDLTGKTVFQNVPVSGNFTLEQELKNLPAGLYYLSLQNEHKRLSKKWVKIQW